MINLIPNETYCLSLQAKVEIMKITHVYTHTHTHTHLPGFKPHTPFDLEAGPRAFVNIYLCMCSNHKA